MADDLVSQMTDHDQDLPDTDPVPEKLDISLDQRLSPHVEEGLWDQPGGRICAHPFAGSQNHPLDGVFAGRVVLNIGHHLFVL
jgi:hypothetical protein